MKNKKRKYALVLSGGGFKGAFQLGALEYLKENGIFHDDGFDKDFKFDIIAGVSVGALNGSFWASNQFEALQQLWENVAVNGAEEIFKLKYFDSKGHPYFKTIYKELVPQLNFWSKLLVLFSKTKRQELTAQVVENLKSITSIASSDPLYSKLNQYISRDRFDPDVAFKVGFVSLVDGLYYSCLQSDFTDDENLRKAILASASIPMLAPPVPSVSLGGTEYKMLIDGGMRNNSPLGDVIKLIDSKQQDDEEYHIVIINCRSNNLPIAETNLNLLNIALRSLYEIELNEIFNNDLQEFIRINDLVTQAKSQGVQLYKQVDGKTTPYKTFQFKVINPQPNDMDNAFDLSADTIRKRREIGYQRAKEIMEDIGSGMWA